MAGAEALDGVPVGRCVAAGQEADVRDGEGSEAESGDRRAAVVCAEDGSALYFSRAPIPWPRDAFARDDRRMPEGGHWLRHIGIYGYRAGMLRAFAALPAGTLEAIESLEQLRALEAGWRIAVGLAPSPFPPGVDTPEDLERAERIHQAKEGNRT